MSAHLANALKYLANSVRFNEPAEFEPEESRALLDEVERLRGQRESAYCERPECQSAPWGTCQHEKGPS